MAAHDGKLALLDRFALDLFARSFAPEADHFSVAVLDTSGNPILRIGKYGNVDDASR